MQNRITMNSKSLQAKFPEVYREFFSKCPIVVSAPGNFFWTGEYSALSGGLAIKQNLPLRVYIGLEPLNQSIFEIGEVFHFVPSRACFEPWPMLIKKKEGLINILENWLKNYKTDKKRGYRINFLCEFFIGCGLSSSGAASAGLATALFLYYELLSPQKVKYWSQVPVCKLPLDKDFDQVFRTAWEIASLFHGGTSSGASCFTSFIPSFYPILYFTEKENKNNQKKYFTFRIDEIGDLDLKPNTDWSIDFGLIYSGDAGSTEGAIRSLEDIRWYLNDLACEWKKIFKKHKIPQEQILFSKIIRKPKSKILESYIEAVAAISLEVLYGLIWVLASGASKAALPYLLKVLNTNHKLSNSLGGSSGILDEICFLIDKKVRERGDDLGAGCKLTGANTKGDILFVVNYHSLRDKIDELISELRKEIKRNIWLDYASWIDGIETEGIKIEQHLAEGIYSKFVSEGSISLKSFTKEGAIQTELNSLEEFEKIKPKIDLLLDAIENGIYIRGEKLTSKEIPSSSATVEILSILLDNLGKSISNSQLPESSYARDRNEIQSKIVSPLVKIIKTKTRKSLPLKISGGLVEFKMKLDPSDLDIRILNKVF